MRILIVLITLTLILMVVAGCASFSAERKHPPIGAFIKVGNEKLHYLDMGPKSDTSPPIVLFHGASANLKDMKLALGDRLAERHRVIIFDRPGRGYSTRPKDGFKLAVQAQLMHDALQQLEVEDPIILGQSLGGGVGLAYALRYQEEISGLVLLASVSHPWPGGVAWYNNASGTPVMGFLLRRTLLPIYGRLVAPKGIDGAFWPRAAPDNYFEDIGLALLFRPKDFKSNAADVANLKEQIIPMSARYGEIKTPTLIYAGTHDTTVLPTVHSYTLANEIEGSTFTLIPNEGHGLHHTSKDLILEGVEQLVTDIVTQRTENLINQNVISPAQENLAPETLTADQAPSNEPG